MGREERGGSTAWGGQKQTRVRERSNLPDLCGCPLWMTPWIVCAEPVLLCLTFGYNYFYTYYINLGVSSWIVRMLLMRSVFCWSTTTACQRNLRWWQRTWSGSSWSPRTAVRSRHARCRRWQQQARRRLQAEFWRSLVGRRGHVERLRRSGWWRWWRLRRPDWRPDRRSVTCSCRLTSTTAQRMTTDRRP